MDWTTFKFVDLFAEIVKDLFLAEYNPRKDLKPGDKEYEKLKRSN